MDDFWSLNEGTFYCLYDRKRTEAFRKAIRNSVRKGDTVVELGAGSGVLSFFAADAGASKVYAVELDNTNISALRNSVVANGYTDKIEVIHADATNVNLIEKVDVVICEMIATGLIEELQVPAMNNALKYVKKGARIILQEYDILLDLVHNRDDFYNKSFKVFRYEFPDKTRLRSQSFTEKHLFAKVDFRKVHVNTFVKNILVLTAQKSGAINGIRISSMTTFSDSSTLDHSLSYSFPVILPIETRLIKKGERFEVSLSYKLCEGPQHLRYSIRRV
jgi:predicted RNA methylase